jgi:hypothetical protein
MIYNRVTQISGLFSAFLMAMTSAVVVAVSFNVSPVHASGDASIAIGSPGKDATEADIPAACDLPAAGLGKGSAQNPFIINSAKSLAEIIDCRSRTFPVTGASVSGNQVTFTSANALGVGHSVTISGVDESSFNVQSVRVVAATETQFTVQIETAVSGTFADTNNNAEVSVDMDFYELRADIDLSVSVAGWNNLSDKGWTPLPNTEYITLHGNNHTINGLTITNHVDNLGLFAQLSNANIRDVNFTNVNIDQSGATSKQNVGTLAGDASSLNVDNVRVQGTLVGSQENMGLLFGNVSNSNIENVSSAGTVGSAHSGVTSDTNANLFNLNLQPQNMGGLIGNMSLVNLSRASSSATVTGVSTVEANNAYGRNIGGLIGVHNGGNISDSFATGDVLGNIFVGGLVGRSDTSNIYMSYATGAVTAISDVGMNTSPNRIGGLIGFQNSAVVTDSYSTGEITVISTSGSTGAIEYVAGFIGYWSCCGAVENSYSTGNVSITVEGNSGALRSVSYVGGFTGAWDCCGKDFNNYATGDVSIVNNDANADIERVGGYTGRASCCGAFEKITASGNVSVITGRKARYIGGLVGQSDDKMIYTDSHARGNVTVNNGQYVGGFIGVSGPGNQIIDSSYSGAVTNSYDGESGTGGLVGLANGSLHIETSSVSGTVAVTPVTGGQDALLVGGLIGDVGGTLSVIDTYVRANVAGSSFVGGLLGGPYRSTVSMNRVYVAGTVTATGTNAIVDAVSNGAFVNNRTTNVFDVTLADSLSNKANFIGKSTTEMKNKATFDAMGWAFDGESAVWKISATENDGYPTLLSRTARNSSSTPEASPGPGTPQIVEVPAAGSTLIVEVPAAPVTLIVEVPAAPATCVAPSNLKVTFRNGSPRLSAKANRQIRSYVAKVKASNCSRLNLQAYYVKNSPLARQRNKVLTEALKKEFWRQQSVVRIRTAVKATKSRSTLERAVLFSVPK